MKKCRKVIVMLVVALLVLGIAGCGTPAETSPQSQEPTTTTQPSQSTGTSGDGEEKGTIFIIISDIANLSIKYLSEVCTEVAEARGYEVSVQQHNNEPTREAELVDGAIAAGAVGVVLNNSDSEASIANARKLNEANIPVVMVSREINESGLCVAQVASDHYQGAQIAAEAFVEAMGEEGAYVELLGKDSDNNAHVRTQGFHQVVDQYPEMEMIAQQTANWSQAEGYTVMEAIIQEHGDKIKGVFGGNDSMALGAIEALRNAGMEDVIVFGYDANNDGRDAILNGDMYASVLQPYADIGTIATTQLIDFIETGERPEQEKQLLNCMLITIEEAKRLDNFKLSD